LELIHYVVFGLLKVPLISKALYYVSSIDDYSRRTWEIGDMTSVLGGHPTND
jgi:hypothetical protein